MRPYAQVSYLPASASFYSAVTQPLGLRFLSADSSRIIYGAGDPERPAAVNTPVFEIKSASDDNQPQKRARLVLSAPYPEVVSNFHAAGLRANPDLNKTIGGDSHFLRHERSHPSFGGESRARITDLDGNIMEVVYLPPKDYPSNYRGSTVRHTQSTTNEVSRILDWNLEVASSHPAQSGAPPGGRRSLSTSTYEATPSPRQHSSGFGTASLVSSLGTVLGAVAAGAAIGGALTYMNMRNDREHAPRQEFDPPPMYRRSTMPDPYPNQHKRYVEVERTVEKISYPEDYPPTKGPRHYPPPSYVARYSQAPPSRAREVEELDDDRSRRHSTRHGTSGRTRTRSEVASSRRPLMIDDVEHRSIARSKHTAAPKLLLETEYRSQVEMDAISRAPSRHSRHSTMRSVRRPEPDVEPHISDRTHRTTQTQRTERKERSDRASRADRTQRTERSASTMRPPPTLVKAETMSIPVRPRAPSRHSERPRAPSRHSERPRAPSRHSDAPVRNGVKWMPTGGKATMYAPANMVPLPDSEVGSIWDEDSGSDSVFPDDSISCVSFSRSRRSYR